MQISLNGVADLADWGVIEVRGEDASKFLHGQLTQDFMLARPDQARLAAQCSPKGRMLFSFVGVKRSPAEVLLLCQREQLPAALKRLSMYVLRAKVKLRDASAEYRVAGLLGTSARQCLGAHADTAWSAIAVQEGAAQAIALPPGADGLARAFWFAPAKLSLPAGPVLAISDWRWAEVRSGLAWVGPKSSDAFVPQMLNYESLGGVSFKKGCYPGQEVVARSQFRGTIKRRAHLLHGAVPMTEGDEVFHSTEPEQACGTVVMCASAPQGGCDAVVSLQLSVLEKPGSLHLGSVDGPVLERLPLPYPLLEDI